MIVLIGFLSLTPADRFTQLTLGEAETGRIVFSAVLREGEQGVMTWRNSLFGLDVTEVFKAEHGTLVLDEVTFAHPTGPPPPVATPADVEDLYQTGGPFTARGIGKSFNRVVYRVGEIGNPRLTIGNHVVIFKKEVGFGGGIILTAVPPTWLEVILNLLRAES